MPNSSIQIASVISKIGKDVTKTAPAIVGLSEIENIYCLKDLVKVKILKTLYPIVHFDGPDRRE